MNPYHDHCVDHQTPVGQRLEPVGADHNDDEEDDTEETASLLPSNKKRLEEERDLFQSSLFALTTHFAQVQFRLRQIVDAPLEDKEDLLKSLEEFSCNGVSELDCIGNRNQNRLVEVIKHKRSEQSQLFSQLKMQMELIENCAGSDLEELRRRVKNMEGTEVQLRTQIGDLERFVSYLKSNKFKCSCKFQKPPLHVGNYLVKLLTRSQAEFNQILDLLLKFNSRLGSGICVREKHGYHWGDLRAKLELSIIKLRNVCANYEISDKNIVMAVRSDLAVSIKNLMEHGIKPRRFFMTCFYCSSSPTPRHSWDVILNYYQLKNGDKFNAATIPKLSQTFNLKIGQFSPKYNKHNLLCVIGEIVAARKNFNQSEDAHFEAFLCAALNAKRLASWLNLIFRCEQIVEGCYYKWSYVANTRFEDSLRSLDFLNRCKFALPVDLDIDSFQAEDNLVLY